MIEKRKGFKFITWVQGKVLTPEQLVQILRAITDARRNVN
ncbi:hypothetical protein LCGC14_1099380 [marine sediment metagenome]|uniref:Uncharacterized protein n=1 Tax=marine sediment metagenome TaxID=412755 RepID=A0A0F9MXT7_9ZZZZ